MKKRCGLAAMIGGLGVLLVLACCSSPDVRRSKELVAAVATSTNVFNEHEMTKYASHYADDFIWDSVSAKSKVSRPDFIAMLSGIPKDEPNIFHMQLLTLAWGNRGFLDGCSWVNTNPTTGKRFRVFHGDILDFEGTKIKVMTTFSDGAANEVAAGTMEPPVPAPPLPSRRVWPTPEPVATKLKPVSAQQEAMARWNGRDLDSIARILGTNASVMFSMLFDPVNRSAFIGWLDVMYTAFPDLTLAEVRTFPLNDNWVGSEVKMTGTNTGSYLGNAPTGKAFAVRAAYLGRYDANGLQTDLHLYYDSYSILNQLGLRPVAVAAKK